MVSMVMVMVMVMMEENQFVAVLGININISQRYYSILNNGAGWQEIAKVKYHISYFADILLLHIKRNN